MQKKEKEKISGSSRDEHISEIGMEKGSSLAGNKEKKIKGDAEDADVKNQKKKEKKEKKLKNYSDIRII